MIINFFFEASQSASHGRNTRRNCKSITWLSLVAIGVGICSFIYGCTVIRSTQAHLLQDKPGALRENRVAYFLPTGVIHVQITKKSNSSGSEDAQNGAKKGGKKPPTEINGCSVTLSTEYVPDVNQLFLAEYLPSPLSNDKIVKISVDQKGLLATVETETEDRSPAIIKKIGELVVTAALKVPLPQRVQPSVKGAKKVGCNVNTIIEPFANQYSITGADCYTNNNGLTWCLQPIGAALKDWPNGDWFTTPPCSKRQAASTDSPCQREGIFYRPLLPYKFELKEPVQLSTVLYLPNRSPILALDISRATFVDNHYTMKFTDGVLTSISWTKPSELEGFLSIPLDLARTVTSIPGQLLTVKVQNAQANQNALEAQAAALQAQLDILQRQQQLGEKR